MRKVKDSFGEIDLPEGVYYGAQTARSLIHFNIGHDKMPNSFIRSYGLLKKYCAEVNLELGLLESKKAKAIILAAIEVYEGKWDGHFPLSIWQTGSGTQTNMNVNEVIATRASEILKAPVHPNDDVNLSQSSNDTFPTVMHITAVKELKNRLLPMLKRMHEVLRSKAQEYREVLKMGRTHLMDALPITLGQELDSYANLIDQSMGRIENTLPNLYELALGATACGTGYLAPPQFGPKVIAALAKHLDFPFVQASNLMAAISSHDALAFASSALKCLASSLIKMATDLSWMGSGPRAGLCELFLPENEAGSSIMPGKINPTQCESLIMVATQVFGNDLAIAMASSRGNFELNVYKPLIIHNFIHSTTLLADSIRSFTEYFLLGIRPNKEKMAQDVERSLMLATALRPKLGYDTASKVALKAHHEGITLKEAALALGCLTEQEFDALVQPQKMV